MAQNGAEIATIKAERQDAHEKNGHCPINPVIVNPMGHLPAGAWEKATEAVQGNYSTEDFDFNGQQIVVGHIKYEPEKSGEVLELIVN